MPKDQSIKSVLIIGSGPIIIGQACEFDYSGSQASRSLKEEGIEVTLINSNPATIMTDRVTADNIYLKPLNKKSIVEILEKHKIDAVLPTMGGQTGLNLAIDCGKAGIWEKYGVKIIGVDIQAIHTTEDREKSVSACWNWAREFARDVPLLHFWKEKKSPRRSVSRW
jgi:carbamoyl-phosphate synthase large subunit